MVRSPDSGLKSPARMSSPHRVSDNEQQQQQAVVKQPPGKASMTGNDLLASLAIEKMGQADSKITLPSKLLDISEVKTMSESLLAGWSDVFT